MADDDLLDIKQAAALLQVSETSLRRWTNAGLLPSFRIGGRRERRFRRPDLLAFLRSQEHAPAGHLCGFYSTDQARLRQAVRFLADGLAAESTVLLGASPAVRRAVLERLAEARPDVAADLEAKRLQPVDFERAPSLQLDAWRRHFERASGSGARALHVFGDVSSAGFEGEIAFDEVLRFERTMNALYHERGTQRTALCLYDARQLTGEQVVEVLRVHPDMMAAPTELLLGQSRSEAP